MTSALLATIAAAPSPARAPSRPRPAPDANAAPTTYQHTYADHPNHNQKPERHDRLHIVRGTDQAAPRPRGGR